MKFNFHSTFYSLNHESGKSAGPEKYYKALIEQTVHKEDSYAMRAIAEASYYESRRPYYLVYPCILELVNRIPLDTPIRPIELPGVPTLAADPNGMFKVLERGIRNLKIDHPTEDGISLQTIALRFPENSYYESMLVCLTRLSETEQFAALHCNRKDSNRSRLTIHDSCVRIGGGEDDDNYRGTLGELLEDCKKEVDEFAKWELELRLLACLGLLVDKGLDFLERDLLARDKGRDDPNAVERATRVKGLGWSLGRKLEMTPHTRRPHFGIRHTGSGRKVPKLVPIKGSIVKGKKLTQVPTGTEDAPTN